MSLLPPRPERKEKVLPATADEWAERRTDPAPPAPPAPAFQGVKRITVEVSPELHLKIKKYCVDNGKNIADEVRALLMERFK
jgi:hypothetical protein